VTFLLLELFELRLASPRVCTPVTDQLQAASVFEPHYRTSGPRFSLTRLPSVFGPHYRISALHFSLTRLPSVFGPHYRTSGPYYSLTRLPQLPGGQPYGPKGGWLPRDGLCDLHSRSVRLSLRYGNPKVDGMRGGAKQSQSLRALKARHNSTFDNENVSLRPEASLDGRLVAVERAPSAHCLFMHLFYHKHLCSSPGWQF
jgi:hypothetical protein